MYFVLAQLFAVPVIRDLIRQPYDRLVQGARNWADTSNVFGGEEAPVHPAVADHFGLRWWRRDHRYLWMGQGLTFDEWVDWYLSYRPASDTTSPEPAAALPAPALPSRALPDRTVATGEYLVTLRDRQVVKQVVSLVGSKRLERVVPYFTSAVDVAVAPYGACFSDPGFAAYDAAETFVASLGAAAVIGPHGVVVHGGKVLADTFRDLQAGPAAPAIAALAPDHLVLQPQVSLDARKLPGAYFCGFSSCWFDDAHWLIGSLPRLVAFQHLRQARPELKLLLPRLPAGSLQEQTLALLGIPRAVDAEIESGEVVACEELLATGAFDLWRVPPVPPAGGTVRRRARPGRAGARRRRAGAVAPAGRHAAYRELRCRGGPSCPPRLRGPVAARADPRGPHPRRMPRATHHWPKHGPPLAYTLFAGAGARLLELFAPAAAQPLYWSVASCASLDYGFLVGSHRAAPGTIPGPGTTFEIPLDMLDRAVAAMLGSVSQGRAANSPRLELSYGRSSTNSIIKRNGVEQEHDPPPTVTATAGRGGAVGMHRRCRRWRIVASRLATR